MSLFLPFFLELVPKLGQVKDTVMLVNRYWHINLSMLHNSYQMKLVIVKGPFVQGHLLPHPQPLAEHEIAKF